MYYTPIAVALITKSSFGSALNEVGECGVPTRESLALVRGECDLDPVVHVKPLGVVVHPISLQRHPSHEPKRLVEVLELELLGDGVSALDHLPPRRQEGLELVTSLRL